jgi:hypothetical protein
MAVNCKICSGEFLSSPDDVVLCEFKEGATHLGCCVHNCSMEGAPCIHAMGTYKKEQNKN